MLRKQSLRLVQPEVFLVSPERCLLRRALEAPLVEYSLVWRALPVPCWAPLRQVRSGRQDLLLRKKASRVWSKRPLQKQKRCQLINTRRYMASQMASGILVSLLKSQKLRFE